MAIKSKAFAYAQEQFTQEFDKVQIDKNKIAKEAWGRRFVAYVFKLLAALGGIAIASGINEKAAHIIGIAIAVALVLDGIFSNHERLIIVVSARNAYRRLLNQVRREHQ